MGESRPVGDPDHARPAELDSTDPSRDAWRPADCEGSIHCPPRCPRFVDRHGDPWLVRPFQAADREPLREMYADFDRSERAQGVPPISEGRLERWLDRLLDVGCNVVAARDGRIAGHALYAPSDDDEPELAVFVHQAYQRRGLGTELCRHVVATAAAADRDGLVLEVLPSNRTALGIYERLGFEPVDEHGSGRGSDGVDRRSHAMRMRRTFATDGPHESQFPPAFDR